MKNHIFVIDTDSYSGNFEREMTGWIMGHDNYGETYTKGTHEQVRELYPELSEYFTRMQEISSDHVFDDEYGHQQCGIIETPGWSNDGMGKHTKLAEGEKRKWPAYQSVGIAVSTTEIPKGDLKQMKALAQEFAKDNDIEILGYRIVTVETVTTEEVVEV